MTALSVELMDITWDWVSSFVMLCQAFTAASEIHAQSGWYQEIDLAISEYSTFLPSKSPELLFLYVLGHHPFVLWRFRCFCQSLIWPGLHLVVNPLYLFLWSLDCSCWQWHVYLLESVLHLAGCCERFALPWRRFSHHPPLLSSMDVQAFSCCWAL